MRTRTLASVAEVGVAIRDARRASGMTQTALSKAVGVTQPWLSNLESGKASRVEMSKIFAVMSAVGCALTAGDAVEDAEKSAAADLARRIANGGS